MLLKVFIQELPLGLFFASGSSSAGLNTATVSPTADFKKYAPPVPPEDNIGWTPASNPSLAMSKLPIGVIGCSGGETESMVESDERKLCERMYEPLCWCV